MPNKQRDPAFLYYDADVALDVAHMDRTERGCYFDLLQMYRKFRGYTMEQVRKVLGTDMESCWNAIELVLELDEGDGKYHIPWLKNSLAKKAQSNEIQRERIQKYWDEVKKAEESGAPLPKKNKKPRKQDGTTVVLPRNNIGNTTDIPLETETETKDRIEDEEGGTGEGEGEREGLPGPSPPEGPDWPHLACGLPQAMVEIFVKAFPGYPRQDDRDLAACLQIAYQIAELNGWAWQSCLNGRMEDVLAKWSEIVSWITSSSWFRTKSISFLSDKFQDLIQAKNNGNADQKPFRTVKPAAGNGLDPTAIASTGFGTL